MPVTKTVDTGKSAAFETRAAEVLRDLREAFLRMLESLPASTTTAAEVDRALNVSRTLGWQIHRVATSTTPLAAGLHVPGLAAVQQMLKLARAAGTDEQTLRHVSQAMDEFEHLVRVHAGDRATFNTMLSSLVGSRSEAVDLKMRRQAFRAVSQAWGVRARTALSCDLIAPGTSSDTLDILSVRGLRDIRRLRVGAPFRLTSQRTLDTHENARPYEALVNDDSPDDRGPRLLVDFCTQPVPELINRVEGPRTHTYLHDIPLGNVGVQTLYLAGVSRNVEWRSPPGRPNGHTHYAAITKPVEAIILDTLVHRAMFDSIRATAEVLGSLDRLGAIDPDQYLPEESLPIRAEVLDLGHGAAALPTSHIPRYRAMIESVCADAGWNADDFHVFRCEIDYPLLSSVVSTNYYFPDHGNW